MFRRASAALESDTAEYNNSWSLVYSHSRFAVMKSLDIDYRDQEKLAKDMWKAVKLDEKKEHSWSELDKFLRTLSQARTRIIKV